MLWLTVATIFFYVLREFTGSTNESGQTQTYQRGQPSNFVHAARRVRADHVGFGFAMVPFYQKRVRSRPDRSAAADKSVSHTQIDTSRRWVTLEFDANTHGGRGSSRRWQRSVRVHPGAMTQVAFEIK